jgi:hypothetical protein
LLTRRQRRTLRWRRADAQGVSFKQPKAAVEVQIQIIPRGNLAAERRIRWAAGPEQLARLGEIPLEPGRRNDFQHARLHLTGIPRCMIAQKAPPVAMPGSFVITSRPPKMDYAVWHSAANNGQTSDK